MIICLMGNDGSGKTTIAKALLRIFKDLGFEAIYKHEYQYTILRLLFRVVGKDRIDSERKKMFSESKVGWQNRLWPFLVWFDSCLSYFYFTFIKKKSIVILDRYLFDHLMSFKKLGYLTTASKWLFLHSPKPDAMLILWVEPQTAYERKRMSHDYGVDFYINQTRKYLLFSKSRGIKTVNTKNSVTGTINEIFESLPESVLDSIWKRGLQNKVLFSVAKKYDITLPQSLTHKLNERKERLAITLNFIKHFFQNHGFKYRIVKTLYQPEWVGNDVDVLVSPKDFSKIIAGFEELDKQNITIRQKSMDEGKADIKILNGLTVDLHSFIGWRNVLFIPSEAGFRKDDPINGVLHFANEKINSIIIVLTHTFEKGFITLDDYNFLKDSFDEDFLKICFPYLALIVNDYVYWIKGNLKEKPNYSYPIFVPISVLIKCYIKLLLYSKNNQSNLFWKIKAAIRDISFMLFWRMRYLFRTKLPFELIVK